MLEHCTSIVFHITTNNILKTTHTMTHNLACEVPIELVYLISYIGILLKDIPCQMYLCSRASNNNEALEASMNLGLFG